MCVDEKRFQKYLTRSITCLLPSTCNFVSFAFFVYITCLKSDLKTLNFKKFAYTITFFTELTYLLTFAFGHLGGMGVGGVQNYFASLTLGWFHLCALNHKILLGAAHLWTPALNQQQLKVTQPPKPMSQHTFIFSFFYVRHSVKCSLVQTRATVIDQTLAFTNARTSHWNILQHSRLVFLWVLWLQRACPVIP